MEKYHKYIALGFAFAFLILLQKFPNYPKIVQTSAVFLGIFIYYNYWYLKKINKYNFWVWLDQALFYLSALLVFSTIPNETFKGLFLLAAIPLGALFHSFLGNYSENFSLNQHLIIALGFFLGFTAISIYFPSLYIYSLFGVFLSAFALSRSYYEFIPQPPKTKLFASLVLGLFCSEFFWAESFLPFHFSVQALLLFNLFYFFMVMNYYYYFHSLNFKKLQFHLILILICSALAFLATPWRILS